MLTAENENQEASMPDIDNEISAYDDIRGDLEAHHMGQWVLIQGGKVIGIYDAFDPAAQDAVAKFGRGPYLIRQVGAPPVVLPASVMYRPIYGRDKMRI
jgi:hypothetical protein